MLVNCKGYSDRATEHISGVSKSQVNYLFNKWNEHGTVSNLWNTQGIPLAFDRLERFNIINAVQQNPFLTAQRIAHSYLNPHHHHRTTITRFLSHHGLQAMKVNRKFYVSVENLLKRYLWGLNFIDWRNDDWEEIVFSDECKLFPQKLGTHWIRRKRGDRILRSFA